MAQDELPREELIARLESAERARDALAARLRESADYERLLAELSTHQVELEAQNRALREAQGQLEDSRSRYADLYDFAPIAYCTFDRNGVVLEINLTGAAMLGRERSRIIGLPIRTLVRLDDPEALMRHLRAVLESSTTALGEVGFSTDRPWIVQLVSTPVRTPGGAAICRTALLDVTQQRLAELDARRTHAAKELLHRRLEVIDRASAAVNAALVAPMGHAEALLQAIVDQARVIVGAEYAALGIGGDAGQAFDPWVFSGMNSAQPAAIGRTPRGVGLLGAVIHRDRPIRLRDLNAHPSHAGFPAHHPKMTSFLGVPITYQGQSRGSLYLANKRNADEFTEEDQFVIAMLADRAGVALEVARLRGIEAREHARSEFLAKAGPALAEPLDYESTLRAIVRLVIPTVADLSAVSLVEATGAVTTVCVFHHDPAKQARFERAGTTPPDRLPRDVRVAIATGQPQHADVTPGFLREEIPDPDHRQLLRDLGVTSTIVVPLLRDDRVVGLLHLVMAESGRKHTSDDVALARAFGHHAMLALERARLYQVAQAAIAARDHLLAAVTHDLRNYLSTITMGAEVLATIGETDARPRRQLEAIRRAAARMEHLMESLRDATMIETGQFTVAMRAEDPAALVNEAIATLEPQATARSLQLTTRIDGELPLVHCDHEQVLRVIANLIGNALKFTPAGGRIQVDANRVEDGVCIAVSDTGPGIPAHELAHIFDRYWRGRRDSRASSGLGLFISKGIVNAHGGRLWAESEVGQGTTLRFTLPLAPPADRLTGSGADQVSGGQPSHSNAPR